MFRSLLRDRNLWILFLVALFIKLFSLNESWVEQYYTYGFYPVLSTTLRWLFGWIPFSIGDLLYVGAFIFLVLKAWKLIHLMAKRIVKEYLSWILFRKYLKLVLWIYIIFNVGWGLNYNRQGIAHQLGLEVKRYSKEDLFRLTAVLHNRLNLYAARVDTVKRMAFNNNRSLFRQGVQNYELVKNQYPFLRYRPTSLKASIFSPMGHYFGFTGYFNPFTSEAQLNTEEPVFLKPFVVDHEIAHQLGYGKENEASFVSYLACRNSPDINYRYSVYYELYFNAFIECLATRDTVFINQLRKTIHPLVKRDKYEQVQYRLKKRNRMQPYVTDFYDNYLRLNNQPSGMATYNEVTAWLVAYMKRFGEEGL